MLGELFIAASLFMILGAGCGKKKNEASKLKPRDLDTSQSSQAPGGAAPGDNKPAAKMAPREADDNETINDAKSDWGIVK